jgi:hypothetical protein
MKKHQRGPKDIFGFPVEKNIKGGSSGEETALKLFN